jgi:hypothetical protein
MTIILSNYAAQILEAYLVIHMMVKASINIIIVLIGFVTQNDRTLKVRGLKHRWFQLGG